jgi:hypothetical protein
MAWGYLWLILVAALLVRRRRSAAEGQRPGLVWPLVFCFAVTFCQQAALVLAISSRLVQTWHGQVTFGVGMVALAAGAVLWLRGQTRRRSFPRMVFVGLVVAAAIPAASMAINGCGWRSEPTAQTTRIVSVEQSLGGPISFWFVRLEGLGAVAVQPTLAQLVREGEQASARVGTGLLGAARVEAFGPATAP